MTDPPFCFSLRRGLVNRVSEFPPREREIERERTTAAAATLSAPSPHYNFFKEEKTHTHTLTGGWIERSSIVVADKTRSSPRRLIGSESVRPQPVTVVRWLLL